MQGDVQLHMVFLGGLSNSNAGCIALSDLDGPFHGVADAVNHHGLEHIQVSRDDNGFVLAGGLVHAGQVFHSIVQIGDSLLVAAACEQAQHHGKKKHYRNQFLHNFLPS